MNANLKEAREKTKVSLKLSTRIQEKKKSEEERLDIENRLRKAKGMKPLSSLDELDEDKEEAPSRPKPAKDDPELVEGGNILADYINLRAKGSAPPSGTAKTR